jgi:FMN-dependent NADH-azoreductase
MTNLLQIQSSLFTRDGQSSRLADRFVEGWRRRHPGGRVVMRDLATEPVPHLTAERFQAFATKAADRTPEQQAAVDYSDALIAELRDADEIVLAVPTYNFGIPSTLKAYFDHIARAGVTFRYTENGPEGLIADKRVHIVAARGGVYAGTASDTVTAYVRDFLNFIGLRSIGFIYAEGLNISPAQKETSLLQAHRDIERLVTGDLAAIA